jgi:hypothetical protein
MIETLIAKVNDILSHFVIEDSRVPADKQMHMLSGFLIAVVLTPFIGAYSIVVVAIIALLKEIYDYLHKDIHTPDFWDWVATVLGGVVGFAVVALLG